MTRPCHILIPCKGFAQGKSRLATALGPMERAKLCGRLLKDTIATARAALRPGDSLGVLSADPHVRQCAKALGIAVRCDARVGLRNAVRAENLIVPPGLRLMVLPIDLVEATPADLSMALEHPADMVISPDTARQGTNLLLLSRTARQGFGFAYGPGSFERHLSHARRRGLSVGILHCPGLARDLDLPPQLATLRPSPHCASRPRAPIS